MPDPIPANKDAAPNRGRPQHPPHPQRPLARQPPRPRPHQNPRARNLTRAVFVVLVLALLVIVSIVQHKATPAPNTAVSGDASPTSGQAQAMAIDQLLDAGGESRSSLRTAIREVQQCSGIDSGIAAIQAVVRQRSSQLQGARLLQVGALQDGSELRSDLIAAFQYSVAADQDYLLWAQGIQNETCTENASPGDAHYAAALAADDSATAKKKSFLSLWDPIAAEQGLAQRPEDTI